MTKRPLVFGIGLMMLVTLLVYSNHFNNTFHFDDIHTIVNNANIRSLKNIPKFFTDGSTFSVLPQNQAYRPVAVTSLALDYWLGGGNYASYFQTSTFILFLIQGLLMVLLFHKIFDLSLKTAPNIYLALIAATWYLLHPANAETVNYIIARADVQSTLFVLLGFVLYIFSPFCRKTFIYLLAVGIGILCKPPAVMFAPLLFCYVLLFEEKLGIADLFKKAHFKQIRSLFVKTLPAFIFCALMYLLVNRLTPKTWEPGGTSPLQYLITQPFVILHYFGEFFLPASLSADSDWGLLPGIADIRFFTGCVFILLMLAAAFYTSKKPETRPVSFGIIWFFLALLPSSSIIPLAEVLNDHRMYFPFVGLAIAITWTVALLLQKYNRLNKRVILVPVSLLLLAYACGTYRRNEVWHTDLSLWHDATVKSPQNARGLMNYGLALLSEEKYAEGENYFKKALAITPGYPFLYTNIAIIEDQKGNLVQAENYYKGAINLGPKYPDPLCYYARFLIKQLRYNEAEPLLLRAINLSPRYIIPRTLLMEVYSMTDKWAQLESLAKQTLQITPDNQEVQLYMRSALKKKNELDLEADKVKSTPTVEKYMNLSFLNYQAGRYTESLNTAEDAAKLNPRFAEAYNNMGAAFNKLKQYDKAIEALKKSLVLKPGYVFAKNNLLEAEQALDEQGIKLPDFSAADYVELSLRYFNQGMFKQCIATCNKALALDPKYYLAYNNICAANNQLGDWDEAIAAAKMGLQMAPNSQILKNNLDTALKRKKMVLYRVKS